VSTANQLSLISVEEYLKTERESSTKHEYLGGVVYAMSGGRNRHNLIAGNVFGSLWTRLRGQNCRPFNSDTKIRVRLPGHTRFYYPDASVVCRPNPIDDTFQDAPSLVLEVLSDSTRRLDLGEKKDAYLSLASLDVYLLAEQTRPAIVLFRRTDQGFSREVHSGLEATLPLPEMGIELPLAEVYDGVPFEEPA
jgi:Uma2 family endonuclease